VPVWHKGCSTRALPTLRSCWVALLAGRGVGCRLNPPGSSHPLDSAPHCLRLTAFAAGFGARLRWLQPYYKQWLNTRWPARWKQNGQCGQLGPPASALPLDLRSTPSAWIDASASLPEPVGHHLGRRGKPHVRVALDVLDQLL